MLVRQKPGSAKGVMFMTIEDETDVANLVIWPSLFEKQRRLILSSGMIGCRGRVQREGDVIHLVAEHMIDLSDLLRSVGDREEPFPCRTDAATRPSMGGALIPKWHRHWRYKASRHLCPGSAPRQRHQGQDTRLPMMRAPTGKTRAPFFSLVGRGAWPSQIPYPADESSSNFRFYFNEFPT